MQTVPTACAPTAINLVSTCSTDRYPDTRLLPPDPVIYTSTVRYLAVYSVRHELVVNGDIDTAFAVAQDYSRRGEWDPFIREYTIHTPDIGLAKGFQVSVVSKQRMTMTVEYVNYREPEQVAMKMISSSRLFSKFSGYWNFEVVDDTTTRIIFGYKFEPRSYFKPVYFVIKWVLSYEMKMRLRALKRYIEDF